MRKGGFRVMAFQGWSKVRIDIRSVKADLARIRNDLAELVELAADVIPRANTHSDGTTTGEQSRPDCSQLVSDAIGTDVALRNPWTILPAVPILNSGLAASKASFSRRSRPAPTIKLCSRYPTDKADRGCTEFAKNCGARSNMRASRANEVRE